MEEERFLVHHALFGAVVGCVRGGVVQGGEEPLGEEAVGGLVFFVEEDRGWVRGVEGGEGGLGHGGLGGEPGGGFLGAGVLHFLWGEELVVRMVDGREPV